MCPEVKAQTFLVLKEEMQVRVWFAEKSRGSIAPGCLSGGWGAGPFYLSVMFSQIFPCDVRAEPVVRGTEWSLSHLGVS